MIRLAIETATVSCSVALQIGETAVWSKTLEKGSRHAEVLPLFVQEALKTTNLNVEDITSVAFHAGPGSYTGLRIGLSFLKGLFFGQQVQALAPATLTTVAWAGHELFPDSKTIHAVLDARRTHVYHQEFQWDNNRLMAIGNPEVKEISALQQSLKNGDVLYGSGVPRFEKDFLKGVFTLENEPVISAEQMLRVCLHLELQNKLPVVDLAVFEPDYLGSPV